MPMPSHCIDCDKPIAGENGLSSICKNCKKKERTKERKMNRYNNIYNIYIYNIYNIKYSISKLVSRLLWQNH